MEKYFNKEHDVILKSDFKEEYVKGVNYKDGDPIVLRENVTEITYLMPTKNGNIQPIPLYRNLIIDLYNQVLEIEKNTKQGTYSNLPF